MSLVRLVSTILLIALLIQCSYHQRRRETVSRSHGVSYFLPHEWTLADNVEDQQRINTFSKLNTRSGDLKDELSALNVSPGPPTLAIRKWAKRKLID